MVRQNYLKYKKLQTLVKVKRSELYDLVGKNGLRSEAVLKCSQELDYLLNKLMKL